MRQFDPRPKQARKGVFQGELLRQVSLFSALILFPSLVNYFLLQTVHAVAINQSSAIEKPATKTRAGYRQLLDIGGMDDELMGYCVIQVCLFSFCVHALNCLPLDLCCSQWNEYIQ